MNYDEVLIRPPSEANHFLLPVTLGCSHNKCTFCGTYNEVPFRIKKFEDIKRAIDEIAEHYSQSLRRVFLENGDALIAPQALLVAVLEHLNKKFPYLERVGTYATPRSALIKSPKELKELQELGLKIAYLGVESGDEEVLKKVIKGATCEEIVEAGRKLKQAGIITSVTVILGLGGIADSERHALNTARILTDIDPDFTGALTLGLGRNTPIYQDWQEGRFKQISPFRSLEELKLIIENSDFTDCFFTSNHASNYLPLRVRLPEQKAEALKLLDTIITKRDTSQLRPRFLRSL